MSAEYSGLSGRAKRRFALPDFFRIFRRMEGTKMDSSAVVSRFCTACRQLGPMALEAAWGFGLGNRPVAHLPSCGQGPARLPDLRTRGPSSLQVWFRLRQLAKVENEWNVVCLGYNFKRLFNLLGKDWGATMA